MLFWKLLNKIAESKISEMGYEKFDMTPDKYMDSKYTKRIDANIFDTITIYNIKNHFSIKKRRRTYRKTTSGYKSFRVNTAINSNEMIWFGIILKNKESNFKS